MTTKTKSPAPRRPVSHSARRIARRRTEMNLTQKALADLIGISRQSINYIETGRYAPSIATLRKLADIFGVKLDYFFTA